MPYAAELPRPSAVVFDWDNTLVDTWPVIHAALARTFETMERSDQDTASGRTGKPLR